MPWIEVTTSTQDIAYDLEGYASLTRTFKVWGSVAPQTFLADPTVVLNSSGVGMPQYGSVFATTNGPSPVVPADANSVVAPLRLYEYTLQPDSPPGPDIFVAVAHYTNDPTRVPIGQHFHAQQLSTLVPIPFVRTVTVITGGGVATGGSISYLESVVQMPMAMQRISQTVSLLRSKIGVVQQSIAQHANELHNLPTIAGGGVYSRFDGADIRMRGVQWIDVTYNWTWEQGVVELARDFALTVVDEEGDVVTGVLSAIYPPQIVPLYNAFVGPAGPPFVLPPFHTIEMHWTTPVQGGEPVPVWQYTLPYPVRSDLGGNTSWRALPGSNLFVWGTP